MVTHLAAYYQSIDATDLTAINTVVDDVLTRTGLTRFLVPSVNNYLHWAVATGVGLTRAQLVAPSLAVRRMSTEIAPRRRGARTLSLLGPEIFKPPRAIPLTPTEELEAQVVEDVTGVDALTALVCLGPDVLPAMAAGDIRAIRATGEVDTVANVWNTLTVTPDLSLEPGTYELVGFIPISATCIAARALITGQVFRPGMPGLAGAEEAAADFDMALYKELMFYAMGSFTHLTVPQFQFLTSGIDTTETVLLYAIKTG